MDKSNSSEKLRLTQTTGDHKLTIVNALWLPAPQYKDVVKSGKIKIPAPYEIKRENENMHSSAWDKRSTNSDV